MSMQDEGDAVTRLPARQVAEVLAGEGAGMAVALNTAEIDQQIATARRYPRQVQSVMDAITSLAILTPAAAQTMIYTLPRSGKDIEGPSVRLAEVVAQRWGNCRVSARVVAVDRKEGFIEAEGVFHDLETNTATKASVRRRITDKYGRTFNDDMIIMTGNAACSVAKRNAILGGVPKAVYQPAYDAAAEVCGGTMETLTRNLDFALDAFKSEYGVTEEKVYAALGVSGAGDIGLKHIRKMRGMFSALKNEEATVGELFDAKAATTDEVKAPLDDKGGAQDTGKKAGKPRTAPAYIEHATAWINASVNAVAARAQWKEERKLREDCGVVKAQREPLEQALEAKVAALTAK